MLDCNSLVTAVVMVTVTFPVFRDVTHSKCPVTCYSLLVFSLMSFCLGSFVVHADSLVSCLSIIAMGSNLTKS